MCHIKFCLVAFRYWNKEEFCYLAAPSTMQCKIRIFHTVIVSIWNSNHFGSISLIIESSRLTKLFFKIIKVEERNYTSIWISCPSSFRLNKVNLCILLNVQSYVWINRVKYVFDFYSYFKLSLVNVEFSRVQSSIS